MFSFIFRYGEIHPHFYMGPLTEAIKEAGGASAKEVDDCNLICSLKRWPGCSVIYFARIHSCTSIGFSYYRLEDRRLKTVDDIINIFGGFFITKQIDSMLPYVCSAVDHT